MAWCTGRYFFSDYELFELKKIFGNQKNYQRYLAAKEWNETRKWLISMGCRENL